MYFADDTKLFCNPLTQSIVLKQDLTTIAEWTATWMLSLNANKCTVLHIGSNNPHVSYEINNKSVQTVQEQKDLGVIVSSNLKWEPHIASITKKANTLIYLIQKAFTNNSVEMTRKLYKTYIRPILEYSQCVWSPYYIKDIEQLERIQRKITRLPTSTRLLIYQERLSRFDLPTLKERRDRGDLIETFKILSGHYSPDIDLSLFHPNHQHNLRGHTKKLNKEKCALLLRKNFLTNRVVYVWNNLSESTVTAPSLNAFKNRVDKDLSKLTNRLVHFM